MNTAKKYVVTGGAGFIGSHLTDALVGAGHEVVVIDNLSSGSRDNLNPRARFVEADITKPASWSQEMKGAAGVFHCAAIVSVQYSLEHPEETEAVNIGGTLNVLQAAQSAGVRRLVFSSSSAVYGNTGEGAVSETSTPRPQSPYGQHKLTGEVECRRVAQAGSLETVCLRYFNVYGPRQRGDSPYSGVIARFMERAKAGKPLTIFGDGAQTRDFVYVSDVVRANLAAMEVPDVSGECFNIGSGRAISIKQLAEIIGGQIEYAPARAEIKNSLADISKAIARLAWQPQVTIEQGLKML